MGQFLFTNATGNVKMNVFVEICTAANSQDWLTYVTKTVTRESCMITIAPFAEQVGKFFPLHQQRNRLWEVSEGSLRRRIPPMITVLLSADGMHSSILLLLRDPSLLSVQSAAKLEMAWIWARFYNITEKTTIIFLNHVPLKFFLIFHGTVMDNRT